MRLGTNFLRALRRFAERIGRLGSLIVLLVAWEVFAQSGAVSTFLLPPLSSVTARIAKDALEGDLLAHAAITLARTFVGFSIAAIAGVTLGILIARFRPVHWFFDPIISVGFPMPKIAFLPIVTLFLGFGDSSRITMIVFDAVFPIITGTVVGARGGDRKILWSARSLGASERDLLREIVLPNALPQIVTGLQVGLPIAMIVCIVTEMLSVSTGIGSTMIHAARFADSQGVFAGLLMIAIIGLILVKLAATLRRRLLLWHPEALAPSTV